MKARFIGFITLLVISMPGILMAQYRFHPSYHSKKHKSTPYPKTVPASDPNERVSEQFLGMSFVAEQISASQSGRISVDFPYLTVTPKETVTHMFTGSGDNPMNRPSPSIGFNFQVGNRKNFADFTVAGGSPRSLLWSGGYGHTFLARSASTRKLYLKGLLSIAHYNLTTDLGSFDAVGVQVAAMGKTIDSTFLPAHRRISSQAEHTKFIKVGYAEKVWALQPRVSLEWHPFNNIFFIEVSAAYSYRFAEYGKLELRSATGDFESKPLLFNLNAPSLTSSYQNKTFTTTPFAFSALQLGAKIGFAMRQFKIIE